MRKPAAHSSTTTRHHTTIIITIIITLLAHLWLHARAQPGTDQGLAAGPRLHMMYACEPHLFCTAGDRTDTSPPPVFGLFTRAGTHCGLLVYHPAVHHLTQCPSALVSKICMPPDTTSCLVGAHACMRVCVCLKGAVSGSD